MITERVKEHYYLTMVALRNAKSAYDNILGVDARIKWRRAVLKIERDLNDLLMRYPDLRDMQTYQLLRLTDADMEMCRWMIDHYDELHWLNTSRLLTVLRQRFQCNEWRAQMFSSAFRFVILDRGDSDAMGKIQAAAVNGIYDALTQNERDIAKRGSIMLELVEQRERKLAIQRDEYMEEARRKVSSRRMAVVL